MVQVNIQNLIDDTRCYQTVRELRWPDGIQCPSCESKDVIKRGFDDTESARQRYECHNCHTRFDDLTDTIFAGYHQPLKVWILCLYFMGLNLSNEQIAHELSLNESDVHQMTTELREGIVEQFDRMRLRQTQGPVLITLGEAQYVAGELDQAERTVVQGQEICREAQKPHGEGHAQRVLGQIALSRDRLVEAQRHLQHALRLFTGMRARYDIARVHLLLAAWGHRQNRPDVYRPCLIEAHHLFRQMHIADYTAQAETLATQLGVSLPWTPMDAGWRN